VTAPGTLVVTHDNADFDALAALVAACKLYPGARAVLGSGGSPELAAFLAVHRERFPFVSAQDVELAQVGRVVVVDVRRASRMKGHGVLGERLGATPPPFDVHIFDHHPAADDDLQGSFVQVEPVGAVTTLLVERLRSEEQPIDPLEATLFALGIHSDTGSLAFAGTTPRDAHALAWLLERGVVLPVLQRYLDGGLTRGQREVLARALGAAKLHRIGGGDVAIVEVTLEHGHGGLDEVTTQLASIEGHAALFALYTLDGRRTHLIARARAPWIHVGRILARLGGGGHAAAGSAIFRDEAGPAVRRRLLAALHADPPHPLRVRQLLSAPVFTLAPGMLFREAEQALGDRGVGGAPVTEEGRVLGLITRRDLDAARRAHAMERTLGSRMSREVVVCTADATLEDAVALLEEHAIGRLPVLDGDTLVGIVTRSDLLAALYGTGVELPSRAPPSEPT
jgi:tRNA nucleotidyltransferase (CCA-adding enzyme)